MNSIGQESKVIGLCGAHPFAWTVLAAAGQKSLDGHCDDDAHEDGEIMAT